MIKIDIFTNLITLFDGDDQIDYQGLDQHLKRLSLQGNKKFIIGDDTGEGNALTFLEQKHLLRYICYHYPEIEFYVMLKEEYTKKVIKEIVNLKDLEGLSGYMIDLPQITNLNQVGIVKHIDLIATATKKDIIIKQHQKNQIAVNNLLELKEKHKNITGLIISNDDHSYQVIRNKQLKLYILEESIDLKKLVNYDGIISNLANVNYEKYLNLVNCSDDLNNDFFKLMIKYFYSDNITSTLKYILSKNNRIVYKLRLPLVAINDVLKGRLNKIMEKY